MIYLGADHGGVKLKEKLWEYLQQRGYRVTDLGAKTVDPEDDYPVIGEKVAQKVAEDPNNRGILICRSGAGVCIAANKVKGIRAAQAWNKDVARAIRNDDNANILCLGADYESFDEVREIIQVFLDTSFGGVARFNRRLKQIQEIENRH